MINKPIISYKFANIDEKEQTLVKEIVDKNVENKLDSYLKKIYAHNETAEVRIDYSMQKNKQDKYEWSFVFLFDGETFPYKNTQSFKYIEDVVNHAFKHFKEFLSKQNNKAN